MKITVEIPRYAQVRTRGGNVDVDLQALSANAIEYLLRYGVQQGIGDKVASEPDPAKKLVGISATIVKMQSPDFTASLRAVGSGADETYLVDAGKKLLVDWKAEKAAVIAAAIKGKTGQARVDEIESMVRFFVRRKYATMLGTTESKVDTNEKYDQARLDEAIDKHWARVTDLATDLREIDEQRNAAVDGSAIEI